MNIEFMLPPSAKVRQRISDCREELAELRRLLKAAEAAEKAEAARKRREEAKQEVKP